MMSAPNPASHFLMRCVKDVTLTVNILMFFPFTVHVCFDGDLGFLPLGLFGLTSSLPLLLLFILTPCSVEYPSLDGAQYSLLTLGFALAVGVIIYWHAG